MTNDPQSNTAATVDAVLSNTTELKTTKNELADEDWEEGKDSEILQETILVYGSIYVVIIFVFCILRKRYRRLFNIRSWVPELKCEIAMKDYGFVSWIWEVFKVDDDDMFEQCGMDALCFIRVLTFGRKMALLGCLNAIWLMPVYATSPDDEITKTITDPLIRVSTAFLPESSPRFLATIMATYLNYAYTMYLIVKEFKWYTQYRHKFLMRPMPRNYAVYVSGIPEKFRSSYALVHYFENCSAGWDVVESHMARDLPKLEGKVARRDAVISYLEHSYAFEKLKGRRAKHHKIGAAGIEMVESIEEYEAELRELNEEISDAIKKIMLANTTHFEKSNVLESEFNEDSSSSEGKQSTSKCSDEEADGQERKKLISSSAHPCISSGRPLRQVSDLTTATCIRESSITPIREVPSEETDQDVSDDREVDDPDLEQNDFKLRNSNSNDDAEGYALKSKENEEDSSVHASSEYEAKQVHDFESDDLGDSSTFKKSNNARTTVDDKHRFQQNRNANGEAFSDLLPDDEEVPSDINNAVSRDQWSDEHFSSDLRMSRRTAFQCSRQRDQQLVGSIVKLVLEAFDNECEAGNDGDTEFFEQSANNIDNKELRRLLSETYRNEDSHISEAERTRRTETRNILFDNIVRSVVQNTRNVGKKVGINFTESDESIGAFSGFSGKIQSVKRGAVDPVLSGVLAAGGTVTKGVVQVGGTVTKGVVQVGEIGINNLGSKVVKGAKQVKMLGTNIVSATIPFSFGTEGKPREGGFVVFPDLFSTNAALQMLHHSKPYVMQVTEAPNPEDIFWKNVGLAPGAQRTGKTLSAAASTALCLFWSIPVGFIIGLTKVDRIKDNFEAVGALIDKHNWIGHAGALISPLMLVMLQDGVLPTILYYFATMEGYVSSPALEASLFVKLAAFMVIQTFFVTVISGSIYSELGKMVEKPMMFPEILAKNLPTRSSFFVQMLVVKVCIMQGLELLRMYPLGMALVRSKIGPNLTAKERRSRWQMLHSLEDPPNFFHARYLAPQLLFFMVYFVYSALAPVTNYFLAICFLIMECGYRFMFIHNHPPRADSGGKLWQGFIKIALGCMMVAQIFFIGFLWTKNSTFASPFMIPLIVCSGMFVVYLYVRHFHVSNYLPSLTAVELDRKNLADPDFDLDFARGKYRQPCLQNPVLLPDRSTENVGMSVHDSSVSNHEALLADLGYLQKSKIFFSNLSSKNITRIETEKLSRFEI